MEKEYKFIKISEKGKSKSGVTFVFEITNKGYGSVLGTIKWLSSYRKYGFYPKEETYFEEECLRNIADFLDELKLRRKIK